MSEEQQNMKLYLYSSDELKVGLAAVFTFFQFVLSGKKSKLLLTSEIKDIRDISELGLNTAFKGGVMVR